MEGRQATLLFTPVFVCNPDFLPFFIALSRHDGRSERGMLLLEERGTRAEMAGKRARNGRNSGGREGEGRKMRPQTDAAAEEECARLLSCHRHPYPSGYG